MQVVFKQIKEMFKISKENFSRMLSVKGASLQFQEMLKHLKETFEEKYSKEMFKFCLQLQEMFKRLVDAVPEVHLTPSCSP